MPTPHLLIVDDDHACREELSRSFTSDGFDVQVCDTLEGGAELARRRLPDALIVAAELPDGRGVELLDTDVREHGTVAVLLVREPCTQDIVEAMSRGAHDVVEKPVFTGHLASIVGQGLARRKKSAPEPAPVARPDGARPPIIGKSPALRDLLASMSLVTQAQKATVLVEGESGTGKELIARAIHYDGPRSKKPFLAVNCATLTENLLEAELFGYEKGSFTGALSRGKKGLFDAASGGTLFLDEVGELASGLQAKLLRVLQEGTIKRVGGVADVRVDVRIIAATNRDLRQEVESGRFRADLFYRLNVIPLRVPPLRERPSDIEELCGYFLETFARDLGKTIAGFAPAARQKMAAYSWPGNVRELRNVCEYAAIVCDGDVIEARHLTLPEVETPAGDDDSGALPLKDKSLKGMESELIRMVLNETRFNITRAANVLGINRSTLYNKMRDYGLQRSDRPKIRQSV